MATPDSDDGEKDSALQVHLRCTRSPHRGQVPASLGFGTEQLPAIGGDLWGPSSPWHVPGTANLG